MCHVNIDDSRLPLKYNSNEILSGKSDSEEGEIVVQVTTEEM